MEMKMIASGIGISLPRVKAGVSLFSGIYIQIRDTENAEPYTFGIATSPEVGGKNGALVASFLSTAWMKIDTAKHPMLCDKSALVGRLAEIEMKGSLIYHGKVDIEFKLFDKENESKFTMSKVDIEAHGGQLASTKIRGNIVDMMGKTQHGRTLCAKP